MAITFNARLDIIFAAPITPDTWDVQATVVDYSGSFSAFNVAVGDVIYNDGSFIGAGLLRYKVISIDTTDGTVITFRVQWDSEDPVPQEPQPGVAGCIATPNSKGVIAVVDPGVQLIDFTFVTAVRNAESMLLSTMISEGTVPADVMLKSVYDTDADQKIDELALPPLEGGSF